LFWPQLFQKVSDIENLQVLKNELIQMFLSHYRV